MLVPNCSICESAQPTLITVGRNDVCQLCLERVSGEIAQRGNHSRRISKIAQGKEIAGVCGGIADSLNMDRSTFRLIYVLTPFFTGIAPLFILYLFLAWVLPIEPESA